MALKQETKDYISKLAQTYGLDEKAMLKKAEEDESAAKLVDEGLMLRSDYSRKQDQLRNDFDGWKKTYYETEVLPRWNQQQTDLTTAQKEAARYKAESAAYRATYGTLEGFQPSADAGGTGNGNAPAPTSTPNVRYMTQEDYDKAMERERARNAWLATQTAEKSIRHYAEFQKPINFTEFEKFAGEGHYQDLDRAYDDFVKPMREEKAKAETEARIAKEVQERVATELAKHGASSPYDTSAPSFKGSSLFHRSEGDDVAARVANPDTPAYEREQLLRQEFMKDLGNVTTGGLLAGH